MNRYLYAHEDNVVAQLNAGISAATVTIPLKSGEGAQFPETYGGSATSLGDDVTLNSTGIGASGISAGDIIENVTDGSFAIVLTVSTNSITTTELRGGSDNTWESSDQWAVNRFVITLIQYDTDGETILKREKVLIDSRSTDTLTVNSSGRGFDGSTAQSFDADDYVYILWTAASADGLKQSLAEALKGIEVNSGAIETLDSTKANDADVVHDTGNETIAGIKTFSSFPITPSSDPSSDYEVAHKKYVDDSLVVGSDFIAGEAIDTTSKPLAVYLKISDGKVYKTDASAFGEAMFRFIGFAKQGQNISADGTISVIHEEGEIVDGFSSLTVDDEMFLTDTAGFIDNTGGTKKYKVARATSTTEIIIEKGIKIVDGSIIDQQNNSSLTNSDTTVTLGFMPKKITVVGYVESGSSPSTKSWNTEWDQNIDNSAWWVNGTTYGIDFNGEANSSTYLLAYANGSNISRISVNAYDNNSVTFRWQNQRDIVGQEAVINMRYIIEG